MIDGYKRIAALQQLQRDAAVVLDCSLRWSKRDSALEQGWQLADLQQRFGYDLEQLARRFDHSVSGGLGRAAPGMAVARVHVRSWQAAYRKLMPEPGSACRRSCKCSGTKTSA